MKAANFSTIATEMALEVAGHRFPSLTALAAKADRIYRLRMPAPTVRRAGFFLIDVAVTADGKIHLIESNGSNAALSSFGDDMDRVRHMAFAFKTKPRPAGPAVVLLCHQPGFIHLAEFFQRGGMLAKVLSDEFDVALLRTREIPGKAEVNVVCGSIPEIAEHIERRGINLFYRGLPIVLAVNANLAPELVRLGVIERVGATYNIDDELFHEGRCTPIIHDKSLQQELCAGTLITPLMHCEAHDAARWMDAVRWFRDKGLVGMAKANSGSGGAGIDVLTPEMTDDQATAVLGRILDSSRDKYGDRAEVTAFPVRVFEFAHARPYLINGNPHFWDLRLQALIAPGQVDVRACVVRICPQPFDGSYARDTVVSNLTGRDGATADRFMRTPGGAHILGGTELAALGLSEADLERIMRGCGEWCVAAMKWAADRRDLAA